VEGIQVERKRRFYLHPSAADLVDRGGLKDHYLALEGAEEFDTLGLSLVRFCHRGAIIA
jgi:hypothetical protein